MFTDLKELVEDWSVKKKFSFNIADKDYEQVIYTCVVPDVNGGSEQTKLRRVMLK